MKAVQYRSPGGFNNLKVVEISDPGEPTANEVRVRLHASSLNGHDYNVATGVLPVQDRRIILTDGAGIVEAVGKDVSEFAPGEQVISTFFPDWLSGDAPSDTFARTPGDGLDGYAAEVVIRPEQWFTHAPLGWSLREAATLPTAGVTAWRAVVVEGELRSGQYVLILGTGGVSMFAVQFAKQIGAKVIVISSSDEKLEKVRSLGVDFGVNYSRDTKWSTKIREFTAGRGVDLTVETAGPGTLPQSIEATRIGGRIVLIGVLTGVAGVVPTVAIMSRQQRIQGITVGSRSQQIEMVASLNRMALRPVIHAHYPLAKISEALRLQGSGAHVGKICLDF